MHCMDGKIQTWWMYHKYSSFCVWIFMMKQENIQYIKSLNLQRARSQLQLASLARKAENGLQSSVQQCLRTLPMQVCICTQLPFDTWKVCSIWLPSLNFPSVFITYSPLLARYIPAYIHDRYSPEASSNFLVALDVRMSCSPCTSKQLPKYCPKAPSG